MPRGKGMRPNVRSNVNMASVRDQHLVANQAEAGCSRQSQQQQERGCVPRPEPPLKWRINWGAPDYPADRYFLEPLEKVFIHSSSHMSEMRGLRGKISRILQYEFIIRIVARGGRKWDRSTIATYNENLLSTDKRPSLHIILLGDNDVRQASKASEIEKSNLLAEVEGFGINIVQQRKKKEGFKEDIVFVNGLIPFPIHGYPNTPQLVSSFYDFTKVMSSLTKLDPTIHFVPMREKAIEFCEENQIDLNGLFSPDKVHLSEIGETFLAYHLVNQIRAFKAMRQMRPTYESLEFFNSAVSHYDKSDFERKIKLEKEIEFLGKDFATLSLACCEKESQKANTPKCTNR